MITAYLGDLWRVARADQSALHRRQQKRLVDLITFARNHSPYYRRLLPHQLCSVDNPFTLLQTLPIQTKPTLMANFDEWVTDHAVTQAGVEAFLSGNPPAGRTFLDRYEVYTTSGTTGTPGLFLQDRRAVAIYDSLLLARGMPQWFAPELLGHLLRRGFRVALVVATGGSFAALATYESWRRRIPWLAGRLQTFSVLAPLPELVRNLNAFQPTILAGYASALLLLADEQAAGRLQIQPRALMASGEPLDPIARTAIEAVFQRRVHNIYGSSEFIFMAFACDQGWFHVNADWLLLEPVTRTYQPVAPGEAADTLLLTNLANRIQPLIRYDLGDSITVRPDSCPCGQRLPAIQVEGRRNDILVLQTATGESVRLLPMAIGVIVEETPGVHRFQIVQTTPTSLRVRLAVKAGAAEGQVWDAVAGRLRAYLANQGLAAVTVARAAEPPQVQSVGGKFRQVWSALSEKENYANG
ncbi:MAG: phenylacetate--CoA ligase family protein [Caldilinea sp. CFX5]|nr:phenylacetate--CoA ligase family protein [Caldilinea sp. CFX5]